MDQTVANSIEEFFSQYRVREYAKGQVLILHGDTTEHVYQLVSGRVKQSDTTRRGDEIILNVFKPPAFFPMSLAINGGESPYTLEAETNIEVREVPTYEAVTFLKENPDVLYDLLSRVYKGTDGMLARTVQLMTKSAKSRLMFELLIACKRFGAAGQDGNYSVAMNESDIAARAGLTRETVSREMSKLEKDKLVMLKSGRVIINDLAGFEEKLENEL